MDNTEKNIPMQGAVSAHDGNAAQTAPAAQDIPAAQDTSAAQTAPAAQDTSAAQDIPAAQTVPAAQDTSAAQTGSQPREDGADRPGVSVQDASAPLQPQPGPGAQGAQYGGQPQYRPYQPVQGPFPGSPYAAQGNVSALPMVSMVLGIISAASVLLCCFCAQAYITAGLGLAAVICGAVGRKNAGPDGGKCVAGIVTGCVGLFFGLACLILQAVGWLTMDAYINIA